MSRQRSRRGSIALNMLDSQSPAPWLESVLSSVSPPSEDAAYQVNRGLHETTDLGVVAPDPVCANCR